MIDGSRAPKVVVAALPQYTASFLWKEVALKATEDRGVGFEKGFRGFKRFTGFRGCGIALRAMSIKSALRASLPASNCHPERQRRISVKADSVAVAGKYQSAGIRCSSGLRPAPF